jgi:uncharacterized protein (DUF1800 family)
MTGQTRSSDGNIQKAYRHLIWTEATWKAKLQQTKQPLQMNLSKIRSEHLNRFKLAQDWVELHISAAVAKQTGSNIKRNYY